MGNTYDLRALTAPYLVEPDPVDDPQAPLTPKQQRFAELYVATRNRIAAYREAFGIMPQVLDRSVYGAALKVSQLPRVAERIEEIRQLALADVLIDVRELIARDLEIATADPNDIVSYVRYNCRYCYGEHHQFQWVDVAEYMRALAEVMDHNAALKPGQPQRAIPNEDGGYGYHKGRQPAEMCPECLGLGRPEVIVHDTTKLTGAARRLYRGIKKTKDGIEVLMHDQDAAAERLARYSGLLKSDMGDIAAVIDKATRRSEPAAAALPANVSEADAARAYLDFANAGP